MENSMDMGLAGIKMAAALLIILGLIFLVYYLLKKYGHKAGLGISGSGYLQTKAVMSLGPKKSIVVVRFLNKYLVLGVTESQINLLKEMDADHEQDQDFSRVLSQKSSDFDSS
ncbi:flagellar biosynthetic protein FliO [Desulfonatronospira sp.]|uniref:flagellar biosynthetic protein FliO n=1 Tax=Desulfonatronospira sp. TaxID=1962951 RepID=UPI0025B8D793|nr:flagellar biosynthetic protein FliO [Desulfonatronospira sp.]